MARSQSGASGRKKAAPGTPAAGTPARGRATTKSASRSTSTAAPEPEPAAAPARRPSVKAGAAAPARPAPRRAAKAADPVPPPVEAAAPAPAPGPGPVERYRIALAAYTDCLRLLQERDWAKAAAALRAFIAAHGRERELADRARMYLSVCEQHTAGGGNAPQTFDERYAAAVILANRGEFDAALGLLDAALEERPESDKALYLKASTLAQQGQRRAALDLLTRAIARDEHNRVYALNDPDFGSLRDDEEFITLTTREDEREP